LNILLLVAITSTGAFDLARRHGLVHQHALQEGMPCRRIWYSQNDPVDRAASEKSGIKYFTYTADNVDAGERKHLLPCQQGIDCKCEPKKGLTQHGDALPYCLQPLDDGLFKVNHCRCFYRVAEADEAKCDYADLIDDDWGRLYFSTVREMTISVPFMKSGSIMPDDEPENAPWDARQ